MVIIILWQTTKLNRFSKTKNPTKTSNQVSLSAIFFGHEKRQEETLAECYALVGFSWSSARYAPQHSIRLGVWKWWGKKSGPLRVICLKWVWASWCLFFDVFRWTSSRFLVQVGRLKDFSLTNEDEWRVCQFGVGCFVMAVPLHCLHRAWDGTTCFGNLESQWIPSFCSKEFFVKLFHIPWRIHGTALFTYMKSWILYDFCMVKVG